jgi:hypothetical protein
MSTATETSPVVTPAPVRSSKAMTIIGWILGLLPVPLFLMSAWFKFTLPEFVRQANAKGGWSDEVMFRLGFVEVGCLIIYLVPQTAVLGAILLTGYLGGAIATHLRLGEYVELCTPLAIGVIIWLGIFLRERRLWALIPFRRSM